MKKYGIFLGRFSPLHNGHIRVINKMKDIYGDSKSLILVGSCANKIDLSGKLFFTYLQRKHIIQAIFNNISIVGLPDFKQFDYDPNFTQWTENMWDIIKLRFEDADVNNVVFFTSDEKDTYFFTRKNYEIMICPRKSEDESATTVRQILISGHYKHLSEEEVEGKLLSRCEPKTVPLILQYFKENVDKRFRNDIAQSEK